MRKVKILEQLFQSSNKIKKIELKPEDKIVAVLMRNQGTAILKTGMNTENPFNKTNPGGSMPYGIEGSYLSGVLYISFEGSSGGEAVAVVYKDEGEVNC
jgi:hypothetical protein